MEQKVVAHTRDGRIVKGITHDFDPAGDSFHLLPAEGGGVPVRLRVGDLKALFYVKDYLGNREYRAPRHFGAAITNGQRCVVTFHDGETVFGSTADYDEEAVGFTLYPADSDDNNLRIFVVRAAVKEVLFT